MNESHIQYNWEALPLEERKKRVKLRKKHFGMFKDIVIIKAPKLRGEA